MFSLPQLGRACAVPLCLLACAPAWAVPRPARWEQLLARRAAFQAERSHTREEYRQLQQGFRAVYYNDPADPHAAEAVSAEAALLAEEAQAFHDRTTARAALKGYEFLRAQYPGSALRPAALLAEARLEAGTLGDMAAARERLHTLQHEAPYSAAARQAQAELATLNAPAPTGSAHREPATNRPAAAAPQAEPVAGPAQAVVGRQPTSASSAATAGAALVTGIRHWSTATYTRVAIDLGGEVTYQAARVADPDRLIFDIHGARLAPELLGRSFTITDNGFLRRVRAAEEPGGVARVVLDLNAVSEYSAFLLPNPERLIIDVRGGGTAAVASRPQAAPTSSPAPGADPAEMPVPAAASRAASAAANRSGLPAMAPTELGESAASGSVPTRMAPAPANPQVAQLAPAPRVATSAHVTPAHPVPNAVVTGTGDSSTELAALGPQPSRVEATHQPTARPVSAVVKPAVAAGASTAHAEPARPDTVQPGKPVGASRGRGPDSAASTPVRAAERTADGETSLVRALGLRVGRIVIDAGHGGHDSGTLGVDGLQEKDVVLDVALRLGKLLHERLGAEIIYTRSDDTFIPLETRTAIANRAQADLFLSIHANSSPDPSARGVETYYLNFTSDPTALDVAARENAAGSQSVHQLSDLVKKITLKDKIAESREFAADVNAALYGGLQKGNDGLHNRGVKKSPFVVLIGANMPSILAEISFVTNARDAGQLREPEYRERVAESLFAGVARYQNGLAGGKAATPGLRASAR